MFYLALRDMHLTNGRTVEHAWHEMITHVERANSCPSCVGVFYFSLGLLL